MKDEALRLALDALEDYKYAEARTIIREALEQPEPDWRALVLNHNADCDARCDMDRCGYKPYFENNRRRCPNCPVYEKIDVDYTSPPKREWQGLTDEERNDCLVEADPCECLATPEAEELMRCIEAKLKQKNGFAEEKNT